MRMIERICDACGQPYPVAKGHCCPNGADKPKSPWREREKEYRRIAARLAMRKRRAEAKAAYERSLRLLEAERKGDAA